MAEVSRNRPERSWLAGKVLCSFPWSTKKKEKPMTGDMDVGAEPMDDGVEEAYAEVWPCLFWIELVTDGEEFEDDICTWVSRVSGGKREE